MTSVSTRPAQSTPTDRCIRACCRILGESRRNRAAEDLLHFAVARLITQGDDATATRLYLRFADSILNWRERSHDPNERSTLWGVGQYSRDSAAAGPCAPPRHVYHAPAAGPYLRPVVVAEILGPTAKQTAARASFAKLWAGRHAQPATAADVAAVANLGATL
jgi:hypothetical protein